MFTTLSLSILTLLGSLTGSKTQPVHNELNTPAKSQIIVVKDLNANTKSYVYFSLATGKEVAATEAHTAKWDLGFSKTTIAVNSGTTGPGQTSAQVIEKPFDQITQAPGEGYKTDGESGNAIPGGSGNSWYKYDMRVHAILPIPGRTILVKTSEGKFAKMEIISYYKGAPEDVPTEESSYFTFRYALSDENGKF